MNASEKPSAAVSAAVVVFAIILAAVPVLVAGVLGEAFSLISLRPEGLGWSTAGAAVVAVIAAVLVGTQRLPVWTLVTVWLPALVAVGIADAQLKDAAVSTPLMANAMNRPAFFTAFATQALAVLSTGALFSCGVAFAASLLCRRHSERVGVALITEAAGAIGFGVGVMALGQALQLDGLNGSGGYLEGARLGQKLTQVAPLMAGAMVIAGLFRIARAVMGGERRGLVPGVVVAAVGAAVVVGVVGVGTTMGTGIASFPGVSLPDGVTVIDIDVGQRPRGVFQSVCQTGGVHALGERAGSPMLVDASAGAAGLVACLGAFAEAGATEVELVGRRRVDGIATDATLAPFIAAPRYGAVVVRRCVDGDGATPLSASTDLAVLFDGGAVCFAPKQG